MRHFQTQSNFLNHDSKIVMFSIKHDSSGESRVNMAFLETEISKDTSQHGGIHTMEALNHEYFTRGIHAKEA